MSWRQLGKTDLPEIRAALLARQEYAMFPLDNLQKHGLAGPDNPALRAMLFWRDTQGALACMTQDGGVFPVSPSPTDWTWLKSAWQNRTVRAFFGESAHVHALIELFGLQEAARNDNRDEPLFRLDLDQLEMPDCADVTLVPVSAENRSIAITMRHDYVLDVFGGNDRRAMAVNDVDKAIERDSHRLLLRDEVPVAMTGLNAQAGDWVQVGGVYTPTALRGQGLARKAVALHMREMRELGKTTSILFAATQAAARAYRAVGFNQIGEYSFCLFSKPQEIR